MAGKRGNGEAMEEDIELETAWNLYRAIREYDAVKEALCATRVAVIGRREPRRHDEEVFDPEGLDSSSSRYTVREIQNLMRHAASIAVRHNLNDDRITAVITPHGINALVDALWCELKEGVQTDRSRFVKGRPDYFKMHPPITFSLDQGIILNPFAYRDEEAFMTQMRGELPRLYRRLRDESTERHDRNLKAEEKAEEAHAKKVEKIVALLNSKPTVALHKAWEEKDEPAVRAALRKLRISDETVGYTLRYCQYHLPTRQWCERTHQIRRTPENPEWRTTPLKADLNERAAPLRAGRKNPYDELPKQARWWAAHKADGMSQRELAAAEGATRSYVNQSIHDLERRFNVA